MKKSLLLFPLFFFLLLISGSVFRTLDKPAPTFRKIVATEMEEGDGARVKRLFPSGDMKHLDPFIMLDEFYVTPPAGFPSHMHKGFEAITYMIDGAFHHKDNLGNDRIVTAGGAQRFSAGKGLIHSEMPGSNQTSHGLQLWINLPTNMKESAPTYQQADSAEINVVVFEDYYIRDIASTHSASVIKTQAEILFFDIYHENSKTDFYDIRANWQGFIYCLSGKLIVEDISIQPGEAVVFSNVQRVSYKAESKTRFVMIAGVPLGQPIKQRGPIVE